MASTYDAVEAEAKTTQEFILGIIPTTFFSAFTGESVLQVLFIALLVGFALQGLGDRGAPIMEAVKQLQKLVFRILGMILWLAPLGRSVRSRPSWARPASRRSGAWAR